jgi:threonyl-tRNA synthetase
VLSVSRDQHDYAEATARRLRDLGLRAEADVRDEKIGFKIREAELLRVPYMLVVGGKEAAAGTVAVRARKRGDLGSRAVEDLGQELLDVVARRE